MKQTLVLYVIAVLFLSSVTQAFSQEDDEVANKTSTPIEPKEKPTKILYGPTFGLNRNYHSGGFKVFDEPLCPVFENGSGWGYSFGFNLEFASKTWSVVPRIVYESRPGEFISNTADVDVLVQNGNQIVRTTQSVNLESKIAYNLVTLDLLYKQEIVPVTPKFRLYGMLGPAYSFVLNGQNKQVQNLLFPTNAKFINSNALPTENNGRTLVLRDSLIEQMQSSRFAVRTGLLGEIGLFDNAIVMTPGLYYDFGLSTVTKSQNWALNSVLFLVDFKRAF